MSVVGFDFGNESCIVAVARQRGIDVVLNDESKRETPAVVCFGDKQRFVGTAGAASGMMNPKNLVSQIKRLIGLPFSDPRVQKDIASLPYMVTEGPDGYPQIHVQYLGETKTFSPTQVMAMILSNLKSIAEKNLNAAVVDCCIGIPVFFTDFQRRAVLDAAQIAGLHPLRLVHETTATALAYGIYKTDLPENDQLNVAFVDVGHASMQVCIAGFKKGQLKILSHSFDSSLGGRDFDEALFHHFAEKFKEEYKIDVYKNARACLRLRAACEKLKKILSANPEAPLNIECLMEEKDVKGFIKRDEFENISVPILERVKKPLESALKEANLSVENVHMVEVIGSGSRVPAIIKILTNFFGKEPRRTLNASECVARGCALQCAILSPTFKVREFQVTESFPFCIVLQWRGAEDALQRATVFPKANPFPSVKIMTFIKQEMFSIDVLCQEAEDPDKLTKLGTYTIGPFQKARNEQTVLKIKVRLNLHGVFSIESATIIEEEEVAISGTDEATKGAFKMDTEEAPCPIPASPAPADVDMNTAEAKDVPDAAFVENCVPPPVDNASPMETDVKKEAPKKKVKKIAVPVSESLSGGMRREELQKAVEKEFEMALQDRVMEETKEKKNAVEAYVYDMRNKLNDRYSEFVTVPEKEAMCAMLQTVEDWLYEEGEDESKGVYVAKLEELKKYGDPIEERNREYTERATVIDQLGYCIKSYRDTAMSGDPKFDHIDVAEKQKVLNECAEAESWLQSKKQEQDVLPKHATPVLLSADVKKRAESLDRICRPIMTKPKPAAPDQAAPSPKDPEQKSPTRQAGTEGNENDSDNGNTRETNAEDGGVGEPMETEKSEATQSPV